MPPPAAPESDAWLNEEAARFASDRAARRSALEAALVNPGNIYSRHRLELYGHADHGWDTLPVWNPRAAPVTGEQAARLERGEPPTLDGIAPLWDGTTPTTRAGWVELGRRVFFGFPMRPEVVAEWGLTQRALADRVGLERTADGALPGLVAFADTDGQPRVGITCAVCHATVRDGAVIVGEARRRFDYGALRLAYASAMGDRVEPALAERMGTWGPGRADVTEDNDDNPVAIPDLWGLRAQTLLTATGAIRSSLWALAIRQDTQLTHTNKERVRPPRELAFALAVFVMSLEPPPRPAAPVDRRGEALFASHCARCHANAAYGGDAIAVDVIGTDPALATGVARGTGAYRVPSLLGVGRGAPYLHHGAVASLASLLDADRTEPGHRYGTGLSAADRAALIAFVERL